MKTLKNFLLGASILALSITSQGQVLTNKKMKDLKSKIGAETSLDIKYLGNGYYTKNDLHTNSLLGTYNAAKSGEIYSNGKKSHVSGISRGYPTKQELASIDNGDKIITPEEIQKAIKKEFGKVFDKYAQKTLNISSEEVENLPEGYKTSKEFSKNVIGLGDFVNKYFGMKPKELYNLMSPEDAVITKEEFIHTAKVIDNYLKK